MVNNFIYNVASEKVKSSNSSKKPSRFTMNFYQSAPRHAITSVDADNLYEEIPHASNKIMDEEDYDHLCFEREPPNNDGYFKKFTMRKFDE